MKQTLQIERCAIQKDIARSQYRKSHNHYELVEQVARDYKKPFDKCTRFGKPPKNQGSKSRVKRILTWINHEPVTLVDRRQADFIQRTRSFIGQVKDPETSRLYANVVHGTKSVKDEFNVSDVLHDFYLNEQMVFWWQCLQDLNNFRQKLKKRVPEVPFMDIEDEFSCLDKLRKDGNINYKELLNLLNWKCSLPVLPVIKQAPLTRPKCIIYNGNIENVQTTDSTKVRAAGLPSERSDFLITTLPCAGLYPDKENLGDQTSVHYLISPSIFTRYGLTHTDFFKIRDKEEIRSIFENIGFEFPEDSFDALWQKGMQKDCTDGVCIETFRELLAASGFVIKKITCS
ncbi:EF-hand domain-containing family member B isoform X2 [Monomorium pharaonis]|uniref:EF-hand domain-containing family member B isoform X2 n=1 Tax=Monomorium pharaonis TaxID=307658 RepID=UPI00063F05F1|nr:EF-hand domain-containing family member B isoform X2 [Monomorium pharaonis]